MKFFENILPSKNTKKMNTTPFAAYICRFAKENGIKIMANSKELKQLAIKNLLRINKGNTKKYSEDLLKAWAVLDMQKYLDAYFDLTINPYLGDVPIKDLDHSPLLPMRYLNLLDIKIIDKVKIDKTEFKKLYIVTYEIKDEKYKAYRPYIELYLKENDNFKKIGYGYDTDDDKQVELFIKEFNYPVFLSSKGILSIPFKNKTIRLSIYDYLSDKKMKNILSTIYLDDIQL